MTLGEVIERLSKEDPSRVIELGWDGWDSWRGIYSELAFSPAKATVGEMLDIALHALDVGTMTGYKGGEYPVTLKTQCNVDYYGGYSGDNARLTPLSLEHRLST